MTVIAFILLMIMPIINDFSPCIMKAFFVYNGFLFPIDINTGIILWFQQFIAIFLKRFINSVRFWVAIIWQLVIPMLFVLWGLLVAEFVPGITSDPPKRLISVSNSAPSADNVTFFYASFLPDGYTQNFFDVSCLIDSY